MKFFRQRRLEYERLDTLEIAVPCFAKISFPLSNKMSLCVPKWSSGRGVLFWTLDRDSARCARCVLRARWILNNALYVSSGSSFVSIFRVSSSGDLALPASEYLEKNAVGTTHGSISCSATGSFDSKKPEKYVNSKSRLWDKLCVIKTQLWAFTSVDTHTPVQFSSMKYHLSHRLCRWWTQNYRRMSCWESKTWENTGRICYGCSFNDSKDLYAPRRLGFWISLKKNNESYF